VTTGPFEITVGHSEYAVCRLEATDAVPDWAMVGTGLASIVRTDAELSIVCRASAVPSGVTAATGWRVLEVQGPFPLETIGVLSRLSGALASHDISLLALSTYDTDYLLVQVKDLGRAVRALRHDGHTVHTPDPA